jgi:UDP-N-acetylmuramate--alanine ligase
VALNIQLDADGSTFDVQFSSRLTGGARILSGVRLAMPGRHNILNALSVLTVGAHVGIEDRILQTALSQFQGVQRRFTKVGEVMGISIIDDYGHHPVEIAATLRAAKEVAEHTGGKVIAIVQPHRYSRLKALFNEFSQCFSDADKVVVADVYSAGEEPLEGIDRDNLIEAIKATGHRSVQPLSSPEELAKLIQLIAIPNDLVVCLGAGNITYWARKLPQELESLQQKVVHG